MSKEIRISATGGQAAGRDVSQGDSIQVNGGISQIIHGGIHHYGPVTIQLVMPKARVIIKPAKGKAT